MKNTIYIFLFILSVIIFSQNKIKAQTDEVTNLCEKHLPAPYVSDGQQYMALVTEDEVAEFDVLFYGGATYRIVACSGQSDGNLIFTLYDKERNEIFTSSDYKNTAYWDFKFENTMSCYIEAKLVPGETMSGFAILLIGFKN